MNCSSFFRAGLCGSLLACLPLLVWPSLAGAQAAKSVSFQDAGHGILVSHLDNGLTVVVKRLPRAPTAVHMLWVRVGSVDEVDGYSGLAHMLEHMMFKGTPSVPAGEFSRRVAALGGRENAFTDRDFTGFFQQIPSSRLNEVMKLEADRFAHNIWPDEEFKKELEVVKEERRMRTDDQPRSALFEQLESTQFIASPYRRPIIGWMNDLDNMKPQNARDFYQTWYAPNNAVLVVVGDVDPSAVLANAQSHYGDLPAKVLPERKPRLEPEQKGIRRVSFKAPAKQAYVALSWKVPGFKGFDSITKLDATSALDSKEALALTVLSALLDGYEGARLDRALTQGPKRVAQEVGSYYDFAGRGPQVFVLEGVPKEGVSMAQLEEQLKAQLHKVAREGVSEAELQRVKAQWLASAVYKRDSLFNQAQEMGAFWARGLPLDTSDLLIDPLSQVTAQEVQAVAQKYFSDDQLTVAYLWPQAMDEGALKRQQQAASAGGLR